MRKKIFLITDLILNDRFIQDADSALLEGRVLGCIALISRVPSRSEKLGNFRGLAVDNEQMSGFVKPLFLFRPKWLQFIEKWCRVVL